VAFGYSQTICTHCETQKIESSDEYDEIFLKQAPHDVFIRVFARIDFADSIVGGFEELLTPDVNKICHYF
jgi:hypothetical protein